MKNIRITIEGHIGSGKTNIALVIKDVLAEYGIDTSINESFDNGLPANYMREKRTEIFENIKQRTPSIDIDVKNVIRSLSLESEFPDGKISEYEYKEPTKEETFKTTKYLNITDFDIMDLLNLKDKSELIDINFSEIFQLFGTKVFEYDIVTYDNGSGLYVYKNRYSRELTTEYLETQGFKESYIKYLR